MTAPPDHEPGTDAAASAWREAAAAWWPTVRRVLAVVVPLVVLAVVWSTLRGIDYDRLREDVADADKAWLLAAAGMSLLAVVTMGLYDVVSFPPTPTLGWRKRWLFGSAIFGWSNLITLGPVGPAIRVFLYKREGMSNAQLSGGFVAHYTGIFSGMVAWFAAAWIVRPAGDPAGWLAAPLALALSVGFTIVAGAAVRRVGRGHDWARAEALRPSRLPRLGAVAFLDWGLTVAAFLLAARSVGLMPDLDRMARVTLTGHAVGFLSLVPGGLGSADAVWLRMLSAGPVGGSAAAAAAAVREAPAAIVVFRFVFYLVPWAVAMAIFYAVLSRSSERAVRWQRRVLASAVGVLATLLLLSVATPAGAGRLRALGELLPLGAVEASHAAAMGLALLLLVLLRGLIRGYRAAWAWACLALAGSAVAHVAKGLDVEEATASFVLLVLLSSARRAFPRRGRVPIGWHLTLAVGLGVVGAVAAVGWLAYGGAAPGNAGLDPLAAVGLREEAPRFARAVVVAALFAGALLLRQALRPVNPWVTPSPAAVDAAEAFAREHAAAADPLFVGVGDKGVWCWTASEAGDDHGFRDAGAAGGGGLSEGCGAAQALVLFQRRGDAMIVAGEPVVREGVDRARFLSDLIDRTRDEDIDLVLHQVGEGWLAPLHEVGFHVLKLGEEAVVDPGSFTLRGAKASGFRRTLRDVERAGVTLTWEQPPHPPALVDGCRGVSDAWLAAKGVREMQFSLGHFHPGWLQRTALVVARDRDGVPAAFANIAVTRPGGAASVDLMRCRSGGVDDLMDAVLLRAIERLKEDGVSRFSLGMAPLPEVGSLASSAVTERLMGWFARRADRLYHDRGLRRDKQKFHPLWEPRYLAFRHPWGGPRAVSLAAALVKAPRRSDRARIAAARLGRDATSADREAAA